MIFLNKEEFIIDYFIESYIYGKYWSLWKNIMKGSNNGGMVFIDWRWSEFVGFMLENCKFWAPDTRVYYRLTDMVASVFLFNLFLE